MSWNIIIKLIIPFVIIVGFYTFDTFSTMMLCGHCFYNDYAVLTTSTIALVILVGAIFKAHQIEKNNRKWKFLYTFMILSLFIIVVWIALAIGDYFYVGETNF